MVSCIKLIHEWKDVLVVRNINQKEENIRYLEKISISELVGDLKKKNNDIENEYIIKMINTVKKKYQLNNNIMKVVVQVVFTAEKDVTEFILAGYTKALKRLDAKSVEEALRTFSMLDADKVKETMKRDENEEKKKQLYEFFTNTEPEVFINDLLRRKPLPSEVHLVKELKEKYELPFFIINPLIHYVIQSTEGKLSEPMTKRYAEQLKSAGLKTVQDTMEYLRKKNDELKRFRESEVSSADKYKDYGYHDEKYLAHLESMYFLDEDMGKEILNYSKKLNQNLLIQWFTDKVAEFVVSNSPKDVKSVKALIKEFHLKYVIAMGK